MLRTKAIQPAQGTEDGRCGFRGRAPFSSSVVAYGLPPFWDSTAAVVAESEYIVGGSTGIGVPGYTVPTIGNSPVFPSTTLTGGDGVQSSIAGIQSSSAIASASSTFITVITAPTPTETVSTTVFTSGYEPTTIFSVTTKVVTTGPSRPQLTAVNHNGINEYGHQEWMLAVIVIGVMVGCTLICFVVWWFFWYRKKPSANRGGTNSSAFTSPMIPTTNVPDTPSTPGTMVMGRGLGERQISMRRISQAADELYGPAAGGANRT